MKVKIFYAPTVYPNIYTFPIPPLGIATVKSYLNNNNIHCDIDDLEIKAMMYNKRFKDNIDHKLFRDGKKVEFYTNENFKGYFYDSIEENLGKILRLTDFKDYEFIGFSVMTNYQYNISICLAHYLKKYFNKKIIFGGLYSEVYQKFIEKNKNIDLVINKNNIRELIKLANGKTIHSKKNIFSYTPDFDGLPLKIYKHYFSRLVIPYERFIGCCNACNFCTTNQSLIIKDINYVIKDIKSLQSKYNTNHFFFVDNGINIIRSYPKRFSKSIIRGKLNIKWDSYAIPRNLDITSLRLLKKSGCRYLRYGMESGSNKILKSMGKQHTVESSQQVLKDAKKAGIENHLLFILDYFDETDNDFFDTLEFIESNSDYIDYIQLLKFVIFKNSYVYNHIRKFSIKIEKTEGGIPSVFLKNKKFDKNRSMSYAEKYKGVEKLCKKFGIEMSRFGVPP